MGLALLIVACALAQQTPVFRAGVADVRVDVQVKEGRRVLTSLTKEDFLVADGGAPQAIVYFGRDAEPLAIVLLLDVSGSMRQYLEQMAGTARQALRFLLPEDRIAVMAFGRRTQLFGEFTNDHQVIERRIRQAIREADVGAGTAINPSVIDAARLAGQERRGRRAVLIVTDNQSLSYRVPDEEVLKALFAAETVLNAIVVGQHARPSAPRPGRAVNPDFTPADVFKLADATGGEAVKADRAEQTFPEMIEHIRTRYTLAYRAPEAPEGSFRHITVTLSDACRQRHPRAEVRARSGYYAR